MAIEVWDSYYKDSKSNKFIRLLNDFWFSKIFQKEFKRISNNLKGSFLEAGCGEGVMSARLSKEGNEINLLDISENALRQAKLNFDKLGTKGNFIKGDIFKIPVQDESFDVVWNQGVLEHFNQPEEAIKEMMRVIKRGGYLIIFVPAKWSPLEFYYKIVSFLNLKNLWPFGEQIFYPKNLLAKQIYSATQIKPSVRRIPLCFGFSMVGYVRK